MPRRAEGLRIIGAGLCPEIVMQADIGGVTIALTELVSDKTSEEIDVRLDIYAKAISRQRAKVALVEALVDLTARREALKLMPDRETAFVKGRQEERARLRASFEAQHNAAGKRAEFRLNTAQLKALEQFDAQTALDRHTKFTEEKKKIETEIPIYAAQVARQRAIIGGADRSEVIIGEPQAEAAD